MSKYEELKERIEALNDGWNKEADDLLQTIFKYIDLGSPQINVILNTGYMGETKSSGEIRVESNREDECFGFKTQCEKMKAFQSALMWLLDNSDILKVDKKKLDRIDKLQKKMDNMQKVINELKEEK